MKTFSKELGFAEQFKEERVGGLVCDFHGCPFSATIVKKTLESNRKYRTKMGERPRRSLHPFVLLMDVLRLIFPQLAHILCNCKHLSYHRLTAPHICRRAEPTSWEDHHLALVDSFYERYPSLAPDFDHAHPTDPVSIVNAHYETALPLLQRMFHARSEIMKCKLNMMTPVSQLHGKDALLRYNASGTKTRKVMSIVPCTEQSCPTKSMLLQEGHSHNATHDPFPEWDNVLTHSQCGEMCGPDGPYGWFEKGVPSCHLPSFTQLVSQVKMKATVASISMFHCKLNWMYSTALSTVDNYDVMTKMRCYSPTLSTIASCGISMQHLHS